MKPSSRGRRQKQGLLTFSLSQLKILKGLHWRWWMQLRRDSTPLIQSLKGKILSKFPGILLKHDIVCNLPLVLKEIRRNKNICYTSRFSRNDFTCNADVDFLVCWCSTHKEVNSIITVSGKSSKRKNDYSGVSFDELGDICSTLSVKTSHRTSRYLCIATLLESSVQCHVHIGEIFAFYGLHHILCYIMSGYCATTHLGFQ